MNFSLFVFSFSAPKTEFNFNYLGPIFQVWYPDSAQKTAQAIREFGRENLPLFFLANWRGFSGGQRDLQEGILQAGSQIVENLRVYRRPVFVYIPRGGELRGGAWVVLDSQINPQIIEMYCSENSRGGVLEPEGVAEIKFRERELTALMHRLDAELAALDQRLRSGGTEKDLEAVRKRESEVAEGYREAVLKFVDLHDSPQRMLAKGVVKKIVPWEDSRRFFALRLRERLGREICSS